MATTLYGASTGTPGITPSIVNSGWTRTSTGIHRQLAVTTDTSPGSTWSDSFVASVHSSCLGQWIYGPLASQTISGTMAATIWGIDATFGNIYISAMAAWIAKPDATLRFTLLAKTNDPGAVNWGTTMKAYNIAATALTSQVATAGDYLVVEGGLSDTTFTNSESGGIGAGNTRTNFTFSNTIVLANSLGTNPTTLWIGQPQPRRS